MIPDWVKNNAVPIAIAISTLITTYAIYGYRIGQLEAKVTEDRTTITTQQDVLVELQISLARVESDTTHLKEDTDYIKAQLDKLLGPLK